MEQTDRVLGRYVTFAYIGAGLLLAYLVSHALHSGFSMVGVDDMAVFGRDVPVQLSQLLGVVVGVATAVICYRHPVVSGLTNEVAVELSKVTWPTRQETWAATMVVIATVAFAALYLGVFDFVWAWASTGILSLGGGNG